MSQRRLFQAIRRIVMYEYKGKGMIGPVLECPDERFYIDIALWCGGLKFAIEVDGPHHDNPIQQEWDERRNRYLQSNGWHVFRIPVQFLNWGSEQVARSILKVIMDQVTSHPQKQEKTPS
ncbi:endonuclease domain-containing protein [Cytobacillus spartinae]